MPNLNEKINYIELPAKNLDAVKSFFQAVFGFEFTDYGPEYTAFSCDSAGLEGGFYYSEAHSSVEKGAALIVFFSEQLESTLEKIQANGGQVVKSIFEFPGGRRFHFSDPNGNEWAVWSTV